MSKIAGLVYVYPIFKCPVLCDGEDKLLGLLW